MPLDKVILPREVAEILDAFIGGGMKNEEILRRVLDGNCEDLVYFSDKIDDLMQALVVGYEAENACFDRLKELYRYAENSTRLARTFEYSRFHYGVMCGIDLALETLTEKYPELYELRKELSD